MNESSYESPFVDLHCDPIITQFINGIDLTMDHIHDSNKFKNLLRFIISELYEERLHFDNGQARLDDLMKMITNIICVPYMYSFLGVGSGVDCGTIPRAKQILIETLSLYKSTEELLLSNGRDSDLDERRFGIYYKLMKYRCNSIFSHALTVKEYAPNVLDGLSCHLLGVTASCQSISQSIQMITSKLSNLLSNETFNQKLDEAISSMKTIILNHFNWLRKNKLSLIKECRQQEIILSVNPSVRAWLHHESYSSPQDLIHSYQIKYKSYLNFIPIPLQPYTSDDLEQTKKDIIREQVIIEHIEHTDPQSSRLIPGNQAYCKLRSELKSILIQYFQVNGSYFIEDFDSSGDLIHDDIHSSSFTSETQPTVHSIDVPLQSCVHHGGVISSEQSTVIDDGSFLPEQSGAKINLFQNNLTSIDNNTNASNHHDNQNVDLDENASVRYQTSSGCYWIAKDGFNSYDQLLLNNLLLLLTNHLLLCLSRTIACGDAYFILNDLYGGDGLVLMSSNKRQPTGGTIKVTFNSTSIKIKLVQDYELYSEYELSHVNRINTKAVKQLTSTPIIKFTCTTHSFIKFKTEINRQNRKINLSVCDDKHTWKALYNQLLTNPASICQRFVTIRPHI